MGKSNPLRAVTLRKELQENSYKGYLQTKCALDIKYLRKVRYMCASIAGSRNYRAFKEDVKALDVLITMNVQNNFVFQVSFCISDEKTILIYVPKKIAVKIWQFSDILFVFYQLI